MLSLLVSVLVLTGPLAPGDNAGVTVVDLTHRLTPDIPVFPGGVPLERRPLAEIERDGWSAGVFTMGEHTGTHLDAPAHFIAGAATVDAIPAAQLTGPAVVIDVSAQCARDADFLLGYLDIKRWEAEHGRIPNGAVLFVRTGWDERWDDPVAYLNRDAEGVMHFPGISPEVAEYLVTYRDITGVGVDTLSVDFGPSRGFRAHRTLHADGIWHVENVANLAQVPPVGATAIVAPLPIAGGSGAPCRAFAFVPDAPAPPPAGPRGEKRLIEFGWDIPTARTLPVAAASGRPFDGVVFDPDVAGSERRFSWMFMGREALSAKETRRIITDLRETPARFRRHCFLRVNVTPGDVDWFDDFSPVLANADAAGRIVVSAELAGILLDVEQYEEHVFDFRTRPGERTFVECRDQVRRRGRELIEAINVHAADLDVLLTYGYTLAERDRERCAYGLLPAFLDGMLDGATDGTTIIDGYEFSYPFKSAAAFARGRAEIARGSGGRLAAGFGVWMDWNSGLYGWHEDPAENWFTPAELESTLRRALAASDRYVWLYTERLDWWTGEHLPAAYVDAVTQARGQAD